MAVNLQTGDFRSRSTGAAVRSSYWGKFFLLMQVLFLVILVALIGNAYIYMNQKIANTATAIRASKENIRLAERELDALRIQRERLASWTHISGLIRKHNLGLRPPSAGQVTKLALRAPVSTEGMRQVAGR